MSTVSITRDNLEELIKQNDVVILDFWASWCGPCVSFAPVFEAASEKYADVVFGKVDTEAEREIAAYFQIRSIPTVMVFREQVLLFSQPGALPPAALDELISKVREVDMDEIRAELQKEEGDLTS